MYLYDHNHWYWTDKDRKNDDDDHVLARIPIDSRLLNVCNIEWVDSFVLFYIVWELHTYILLQFCNEKEYPPITPAIVEVNWKKGPVQSIRTNWKNDNEGICIYSVWPFLLFGLAIPWFGPAEHINVHLHEDKGAMVDKSWKAGPWPATVVFGFIPSR